MGLGDQGVEDTGAGVEVRGQRVGGRGRDPGGKGVRASFPLFINAAPAWTKLLSIFFSSFGIELTQTLNLYEF